MLDENAPGQGPVEGVKEEIEVGVLTQFSAGDPATESEVVLTAARPQVAFAESLDQIFVALTCGKNCRDDSSAAAAENLDQLPHLLAHVRIHRTSIRKAKLPSRAACERVRNQSALIRPPSVYRRFADRSVFGNFLNF